MSKGQLLLALSSSITSLEGITRSELALNNKIAAQRIQTDISPSSGGLFSPSTAVDAETSLPQHGQILFFITQNLKEPAKNHRL